MERILYTKYSNERTAQFAIRTDIVEKDGSRQVRKKAYYEAGKPHIRKIYEAYEQLSCSFSSTRLLINQCRWEEDGIYLEYLKGQTLQEELDRLLEKRKIEKFQKILREYMELILQTAENPFCMTEEFRKVFGDVKLREGFYSAPVTDIDMVLSNIFIDEKGEWTLIDYEWTFLFPIPIQFVLYRILHYYECSNAFRSQIGVWDLYAAAGISPEDREVFLEMEKHFQAYVIGNYVPLRKLYPKISPGKTGLHTVLKRTGSPERVQIFLSQDGILREEESEYYAMPDGKVKLRIEIGSRIRRIRLDPGEQAGRVKLKRLEWENGEKCQVRTNGIVQSDQTFLFLEEDPQIYIESIPANPGFLCLEISKDSGQDGYVQQILKEKAEMNRQKEVVEALKKQLAEKEKLIAAMENTKVWKTYTKYKKVIKGE